jgi:hypothetical protein
MQTVETGDWTNPRLCQSIKLANVNGIQSTDIIRFYEGERRPGIDYPWSIALTEENQDDTTWKVCAHVRRSGL